MSIVSTLLRLSFFKELDVAQGVGGNDAADGADAVRGVDDLFVRVQNEIRGVDDLSPLLPKRAYFVRISRHFESVGHRKHQLQFIYGLFSFLKRIYGKGNDVDVLFLELLDV